MATNAAAVQLPDGTELTWETDMIEVTSLLPYPDEQWTATDSNGHEHRWDHGYPTLTWVVDVPADEEYAEEGHHECSLCAEPVTPGVKGPDAYKRFIPGMTRCYLNGEPITEAEGGDFLP